MAKNKKIQPLGTVIRQKSLLNEDLRVGDMVVCIPTSNRTNATGFGIIVGETPCYTRVIQISTKVIHGKLPANSAATKWGGGAYRTTLHEGKFYKLRDPGLVNGPWCAYIHQYIKDNT